MAMSDNFNDQVFIDSEKSYVSFLLNPKIYSLKVIHLAAYSLMDRMSVLIGGDPEKEIRIELRPFDISYDLKVAVVDFKKELASYSVYTIFSEESKEFRNALLNSIINKNLGHESDVSDISDVQSNIDDVEKIFSEWEESIEDGSSCK